jgi:hypothetical protein
MITPYSIPSQAEPIPLWVTGFAEPILTEVARRKPDFQDDFSLNRGWLNVLSQAPLPLYAERQDGMLFLKLTEGAGDSILYNPRINRTDFVLTMELRFVHDQPDDTVRFQFDQFPNQRITFDLSNNRNWKFQWDSQNDTQFASGIYEHFPPENIPVTILMRGAQCAVYLNNDPLAYSSNCRADRATHSKGWAVTFRLLRDNSRAVTVNFDNLKLWDLDKIPDFP